MRRILVTHALPYANGSLHLSHDRSGPDGHWVRFSACAGMTACSCARKIPWHADHDSRPATGPKRRATHRRHGRRTPAGLPRSAGGARPFHSTHSRERALHLRAVRACVSSGHITSRSVRQGLRRAGADVLPDRYVRGTARYAKCGSIRGTAARSAAQLRRPN